MKIASFQRCFFSVFFFLVGQQVKPSTQDLKVFCIEVNSIVRGHSKVRDAYIQVFLIKTQMPSCTSTKLHPEEWVFGWIHFPQCKYKT